MFSSRNVKRALLWYRRLWLLGLRGLPHHAVGQLVFVIARLPSFLGRWLVKAYVRFYAIKLEEAQPNRIESYTTLHQLFTRRLKENARELCRTPSTLMSPCDGRITQLGTIKDNTILQVKKQQLLLSELLGGGAVTPADNRDHLPAYKRFCIIYLAPSDCHRVFMPVDGSLDKMIHIPGRLFPVSPRMTKMVAAVHQHNERVVCMFTTALGRLAIVLVGAMNVGTISTSWHGVVAPARRASTTIHYQQNRPPVYLRRGQELGCFQLGSSVVLLLENEQLVWNPAYPKGKKINLGVEIASIINQEETEQWQEATTDSTSSLSNVATVHNDDIST